MVHVEGHIILETRGEKAIIILNIPQKLNALTPDHYYRLATLMRHIATLEDIYITILTGTGRFFSAGADINTSHEIPTDTDARRYFLQKFISNSLEVTHAFAHHPKILITALNGPAFGFSAALIAHSDFIYAVPHTFVLTPFTSLGLVAEGAASQAFVTRLGISKVNEALIMSKSIPCHELVAAGFVNKVFDVGPNESERFLGLVLAEVKERFTNLNGNSLTKVKALIRRREKHEVDAQTVAELMLGLEQLVEGSPQKEFGRIVSGEKKHKL